MTMICHSEEVIEDPAASAFTDEDMSSIEDMLEHLTEQERVIIQARYGFGDEQAHTQQEVALALGMRLNRVQELIVAPGSGCAVFWNNRRANWLQKSNKEIPMMGISFYVQEIWFERG